MAHYAKVENSIVTQVIVADADFINSGAVGDPSLWLQTSYNTFGGVHYDPNTNEPDGGVALRKNYAGIGFTYDAALDAFIPPKSYPSWILNTQTCLWEAPIPYPNDGNRYVWNEQSQSWLLVEED